jgi:hypothetical protein
MRTIHSSSDELHDDSTSYGLKGFVRAFRSEVSLELTAGGLLKKSKPGITFGAFKDVTSAARLSFKI